MDIITRKLGNLSELEIYPLADLHWGDPKTDEKLFKSFLRHIMAEKNRYMVINGDMVNNAIKTSVSNVYNELYPPGEQKYMMIELLRPVADRIICITPGNHEQRSLKDVDLDITKDIAYGIGIEERYRENGAYVNINFGKDRHGHKLSYTGYIIHGIGAGRSAGAPANVLEKMPLTVEADFYVIAHVHRKLSFKNTYLKPNAIYSRLEQRERAFIVSPPWQDFGGYSQRKMYTPQSKGAVVLKLNGRRKEMKIEI